MYYLHEKKLILYGAGDVSKVLTKVLKENNLEVYRYVDMRYEELRYFEGSKVESIDWLETLESKDEYAVIITIKNVFQQTELAKRINEFGFQNIIYKPLSVLYGMNKKEELERVNKIHEILVEEDRIPYEEIPSFDEVLYMDYADTAIIEEGNEEVLINFPAEFIFISFELNSPWYDKNLFSCYPAIDVYRAFQSNSSTYYREKIEEYIRKVAVRGGAGENLLRDEQWYRNVVESRYMVYQEMKKMMALKPYFFREHAGTLKRLSNGHYQLVSSGKNRVSTLISERYSYIPVYLSKKDYEIFLNKDALNKLIDYLEHTAMKVFAPIAHPFFYRYPCVAPDYLYSWIEPVVRLLSKYMYLKNENVECSGYLILDGLKDDEKTSRFMQYIGYKRELLYSKSELARLLDELFYVPKNSVSVNELYEEKILLWDSRRDESLLREILRNHMPNIVFVQLWETNYGIENVLNEEGMIYKFELGNTYWQKKFVCIAAYTSEERVRDIIDNMVLDYRE